jgi:hypothetical protein
MAPYSETVEHASGTAGMDFAPVTMHGWFKAVRSEEALELIRLNPNAFLLAYFIAARARYRDGFNADGLEVGEARLGDYERYGMTEQQYRTAKQQLQRLNFATFRTTSKGTIGKLIGTRLFDPLNVADNGQNNTRPTDDQRTTNGQVTTNKNVKKLKNAKEAAPSWEEFWNYCQSINLKAEFFVKNKYDAACAENWQRQPNWKAYAHRVKDWWEEKGCPMSPGQGTPKAQLKADHSKGF